MVAQHLLDLARLDTHARLAHDLCRLADPHHQHELDALRLAVVGVLDARVAVLCLRAVEVRGELRDAARAGCGEGEGVGGGGGVGDEEPLWGGEESVR